MSMIPPGFPDPRTGIGMTVPQMSDVAEVYVAETADQANQYLAKGWTMLQIRASDFVLVRYGVRPPPPPSE